MKRRRARGAVLAVAIGLMCVASGPKFAGAEAPEPHAAEVSGPRVALSEDERRWLSEHPVIRVGVDPEFHPFEFLDEDGVHRGIAADYLALLGPRLGVSFRVDPDLAWQEAVESVKTGGVDLLASVGRTEMRAKFLRYSSPYTEFQRVIVTRTDMPFLSGLDDLDGLRVAVQTSSSHEGFLREQAVEGVVGCPTLEACVRAVSVGEVDALVGNVASLAHWIRRLKLMNLKVAGAASDETHTLHFASRADWPLLASSLEKALASVTDRERQAIGERWVVLSYEPKVDRSFAWRVAAGAALVIGLLSAWLLYVRRQKRVLQRARDEAVTAEARAKAANVALDAMRRDLEQLVEQRTTELVAAERRFQEAQKMEALGTLVGGIAHDFNNILQGILGALFLVERELVHEADRQHVQNAAALGTRGADLIRQLLAVARKGPGSSKSHVDLVELSRELEPILRTTLSPIIAFERETSAEPLVVHGNAAMLQQVVLNLVNNARDAVLGQRAPRIRLALRALGAEEPRPAALGGARVAVIELQDNGPGIAPELAERIFDPFFTTKSIGRGTGLGLAMVFGAVQSHGGEIEVDSSEGVGTTFRVYLPLAEESAVAPRYEEGELAFGNGETILLVDDEPVVLEGHVEILRRLGYRTLSACDGEQALAILEEQGEDVQLVILDVLMPALDGAAAGREIRRRWPRIPVAYLSAYDPEGDLPDRLHPGGEVALTKPCTPQELSRAIREVLSWESVAEPAP